MLSTLKRIIHRILKLAGYKLDRNFSDGRILLKRRIDLTSNPYRAVKTILGRPPRTIFDVGANSGQTALEMAHQFPAARIFSFEPTPSTYALLEHNVRHLRNVTPVNIALGDEDGVATLYANAYSLANSLLPSAPGAEAFVQSGEMIATQSVTQVPVRTILQFCKEHNDTSVDLLKIDAQGFDLKVLQGAEELLSAGAIPLVYIEVCFVRFYVGGALFPDLYNYLYENKYRLVDFYEKGINTHFYQLSCNALFVHESFGRTQERA